MAAYLPLFGGMADRAGDMEEPLEGRIWLRHLYRRSQFMLSKQSWIAVNVFTLRIQEHSKFKGIHSSLHLKQDNKVSSTLSG